MLFRIPIIQELPNNVLRLNDNISLVSYKFLIFDELVVQF